MTATNHALSGALIAAIIPNPLIGLPLAITSHFLLDAMPHFGLPLSVNAHSSKMFTFVLGADILGAFIVGLCIVFTQPQSWVYMGFAAFLATSPDLMWFPAYRRSRNGGDGQPGKNIITWFHAVIQWCEKPWGIAVEAAYATLMITLLMNISG